MTSRILTVLALAAALAGELGATAAEQPKVNINTATVHQLQLLPRIGPSTAGRIVEFRKANGPFKAIEEIMRVRGVGERTFELLKPYLSLEGDTTLAEKVRSSRRKRRADADQGPPSPGSGGRRP